MPSPADRRHVEISEQRICARTGLALVRGPARALRVARESYGPLSPPPRVESADPAAWSRYDTIGRTIYACEDRLTAFMELLAPYRTEIAAERRALQPVADALGEDLEELWASIVAEWDEAGTMKASWLPRAFREGRMLYTLTFPEGWWIDIAATETMNALEDRKPIRWPTATGSLEEPLTLAHLTGEDRTLTTALASTLRHDVVLDDDTLPVGIRFLSKHGHPAGRSGVCWAYWMRAVDAGLDEPAEELHRQEITEGDRDLLAAQRVCKIKSR